LAASRRIGHKYLEPTLRDAAQAARLLRVRVACAA
jgi:hypothetical protein